MLRLEHETWYLIPSRGRADLALLLPLQCMLKTDQNYQLLFFKVSGVAQLRNNSEWGSNRTNNIDGAEVVRVAHNAMLVSRMHLTTIALLCKQTTDYFQTRHPPEPRWRHLSGNRILFVPHWPPMEKTFWPLSSSVVHLENNRGIWCLIY